jgi:hypothetical protein
MKKFISTETIIVEIMLHLSAKHETNYSVINEVQQPNGEFMRRKTFIKELIEQNKRRLMFGMKDEVVEIESENVDDISRVISFPLLLDNECFCLAIFVLSLDDLADDVEAIK